MSCFDTLIGQDNGCATTSGTLYLKDIGITNDFITALVAKHNATTEDWMAERRRLATEYVIRDAVNHYGNRTIPRTFVDNQRLGKYPDTEVIETAEAGYLHGVLIDVCTPASNTKLHITGIDFFGDTTGDVTVTVYDLSDGTTVATETVAATADAIGSLAVDISLPCYRQRKRFLVTTDQTTFYRATMSGNACRSCAVDRCDFGVLEARSVRILSADRKVYANTTNTTNDGGLSLTVSLECDHGAWLCEMKAAMGLSLLYCLGREIFTAALYNFERWGIQNLRREDVEGRRDELEALYSKAMGDFLKWMPLPRDPLCFVCDSRTSTGVILP